MAIFNDFYPQEYFSKQTPVDIRDKATSTCIVCAVGQPFLDVPKATLKTKTSGYYYNNQPMYPYGGNGKLCDAIAGETAVWMTGTAFAIESKTFMTAAHVVQDVLAEVDAKPNDASKLKLMSGFFRKSSPTSPFTFVMYDVTAITYHPDKDICKITTKQSVKNGKLLYNLAPITEQRSLRTNDAIMMAGYPLGQTMKFSEGIVADTEADLSEFKGYITLFPGNSGSPVLSRKTGNVVGILTGGSEGINDDWKKSGDGCYTYQKFPNQEEYTGSMVYAEHLKF
ncbi:MAG: serine protease [Bacteriodetes bacterium]|nr:serine protease [Bacteroidota bacterium]